MRSVFDMVLVARAHIFSLRREAAVNASAYIWKIEILF